MTARRVVALLALVALAGCSTGDATTGTAPRPSDLKVDVLTTGLEVPWDLAVLPTGQLLVTERPGRVRLVERDGRLRPDPVAVVPTRAEGEGGLLGIALDPDFARGTRFAYLYATTAQGVEVQRWRVAADGPMSRDGVVLAGIQAGPVHDAGRLRFGPDRQLYVLTGDGGRPELAQDPRSLNGKVLRLTPRQYRAGTTAPEVVAQGLRNPQGLSWQPDTDRMIVTDHGPSGAQSCCDEVDVVTKGANFGWPVVFGKDQGRFTAPARLWQQTIAPAGATFVSVKGSLWTRSLLVASLRGTSLRRLVMRVDRVASEEVLLDGRYGRLRAVVEAPDGTIYVTTSNRDGRGRPSGEDDRILRLTPPTD